MRIGELAARAKVATSAIRYYERIGILPPAARVNGRREYPPDALARLAVILHARRVGFTIAETARLVSVFPAETPSARWKALAKTKLVEMEALITQAEAMKATLEVISNCRCESWDECGTALLTRLN